jgi:hypothetical protein
LRLFQDGTNAVRFYEISNYNKEIQKLPKQELEEIRIENYPSDLFHNFISFFQGKSSNYNISNKEFLEKTNIEVKMKDQNNPNIDLNTAQSLTKNTKQSTHATSNGGLLKVTAFDLTKSKDTDFALQEIIRRQRKEKQENENKNKSANSSSSKNFNSIKSSVSKDVYRGSQKLHK